MKKKKNQYPKMDADYAIIEQISSIVEGDFLGPLQGICSRLKEIFNSKFIGIFVFDIGFKQFVEMAYSLDRNTEKGLLLNEVTINSSIILNNLKKILQNKIIKSDKIEINLGSLSTIETYEVNQLSKIFSALLNIDKNSGEILVDLGIHSCHLVPILKTNQEYTSILFMFMEKKLSPREHNILETYYLRQLNLVVQHIIDIKGLYSRAMLDELTGIYNRRFGTTSLEQYLFLLMRNNLKCLSMIFMDIDDFKKINDNYGHQMGDEVLITLCQIIQKIIRKTDIFIRYGGEEFCIILPDAELNISLLISQRIQKMIKNHSFNTFKNNLLLTLSIGILEYDKEKNYGSHQFLDEADKLMYEAKKTGKDRICYKNLENEIIIKKEAAE